MSNETGEWQVYDSEDNCLVIEQGKGTRAIFRHTKNTHAQLEFLVEEYNTDHNRAHWAEDVARPALEAFLENDYDHDLDELGGYWKASCGCSHHPDGDDYVCGNHGPDAFIKRLLSQYPQPAQEPSA